jgi:hypothetical protein
LWRERFPVIPGSDVDVSVATARADLGALAEALAAFDALESGAGRLVAIDTVSGEMSRQHRALLDAIDPSLDAPTARVLTLILADLDATRPTGELTEPEAAAVRALEAAPFPPLLPT